MSELRSGERSGFGSLQHRRRLTLLRAYLIITGLLFGLLASIHLWQTITHRSRLLSDPGFLVEGPGIGLVGGALAFWAWRLLRRSPRVS